MNSVQKMHEKETKTEKARAADKLRSRPASAANAKKVAKKEVDRPQTTPNYE